MDATRIRHNLYGPGTFVRLLETPGHARVAFDIDDGIERRVLTRDLTPEPLAERVARHDAALADMMGRDPAAVTRCLRAGGGA